MHFHGQTYSIWIPFKSGNTSQECRSHINDLLHYHNQVPVTEKWAGTQRATRIIKLAHGVYCFQDLTSQIQATGKIPDLADLSESSKIKEKHKRVCRRRRSYSLLLSFFPFQLPLCFPEPSPGTQSPLSTSSSTTSRSRSTRPPAMPVSEARISATAGWEGRGVLSHTQSCLTQLSGVIQNNMSSPAPPGALALGQDSDAQQWVRDPKQTHHFLLGEAVFQHWMSKASLVFWNFKILIFSLSLHSPSVSLGVKETFGAVLHSDSPVQKIKQRQSEVFFLSFLCFFFLF